MSNDKVVRPDGYYLAIDNSEFMVVEICNCEIDGYTIYKSGTTSEFGIGYFNWIADEPLDLECIKLLQMNGGLQNAVELVKKDATIDKGGKLCL